ncbi:MAG: hypothetical protein O3A14_01250 [Cyanobacteria bacterium]|nr:hypothetical protein [Cyanobacteriota bacterium]
MVVKPVQYETLLSTCSDYAGAMALLRQHRPYLEVIPSMRRPQDSIVALPLPNIRIRQPVQMAGSTGVAVSAGTAVSLPCDVVLLMCDPEWKIKTGVELFILIHRPQEDFSDLLMRWRRTQILLDGGYEWFLPARHQHLLSEGADTLRPLFVVFPESPDRILKGLKGAGLPTVVYADPTDDLEPFTPLPSSDDLHLDETAEFDVSELDDLGPSNQANG